MPLTEDSSGSFLLLVDTSCVGGFHAYLEKFFFFFFVSIFVIKVLIWNVCRAGNKKFLGAVKDLIHIHIMDFLVILEPQISGFATDAVINHIGFDKNVKVDAISFSSGIYVMWNDNIGSVNVISLSPQYIDLLVYYKKGLLVAFCGLC